MAELKTVGDNMCSDTEREHAAGGEPRQYAGPQCRQGPTSHLQSVGLVHRTGFGGAASPSSGLGHLQIHGRLKQETATQSGCYARDEEGSGTFLTPVGKLWGFWGVTAVLKTIIVLSSYFILLLLMVIHKGVKAGAFLLFFCEWSNYVWMNINAASPVFPWLLREVCPWQ